MPEPGSQPDVEGSVAAKPKTKARRKAKPRRRAPTRAQSSVEMVELQPLAPRFVDVAVHKKAEPSWVFIVGQILFASVVIVGAFFIWQQVSDLKRDVVERTAEPDQDVSDEFASLKSQFDSLVDEWGKQREQAKTGDKRLSYQNVDVKVFLDYPAELGSVTFEQPSTIRFSANPDIWLSSSSPKTCDNPLMVSDTGYCDVLQLQSGQAIQHVYAEYNESEELQRVVMAVEWGTYGVYVDLGTPPLAQRNVFAPVDSRAQQDALQDYYRDILKKESLADVTEESLRQFLDVVEHIRMLP